LTLSYRKSDSAPTTAPFKISLIKVDILQDKIANLANDGQISADFQNGENGEGWNRHHQNAFDVHFSFFQKRKGRKYNFAPVLREVNKKGSKNLIFAGLRFLDFQQVQE
jgi:hypothetical protein